MYKRSFINIIIIVFLMAFISPFTFAATKKKAQLKVNVQPTEAVVSPNEQVRFTLKAQTDKGEELDVKGASVRWYVVGKVGNISGDGVFTAGDAPGRGLVRAVVKTDQAQGVAHALIKLGRGPMPGPKMRVQVAITPNVATVPPGGTQQFTVNVEGLVSWRVIPPRIGTITPTGLLAVNDNAGRGIVIATVRTNKGVGTARASVYVGDVGQMRHGPKCDLTLTPKHTHIQPGASITFTAQVAPDKGEGLDFRLYGAENLQTPYAWNVTPSHLGKVNSISPDKATFTAGDKSGRALVTASLRTEMQVGMGWAMVDIGKMPQQGGMQHGRMQMSVNVLPNDVTVDVGETAFFNANVTGDVKAQPVWSVMPSQVGKIDRNGAFTPIAPGWCLVIAKVETERGIGVGQARVFVGTAKYMPLRVTISPKQLDIGVDDAPTQLTAKVTAAKGEPVAGIRLSWQVFPKHIGSIDQNGVFTSKMHTGNGIVTVSAKTQTGSGSAQVRVTVREVESGKKGHLRFIVSVSGKKELKVGASAEFVVNANTMHGEGLDLSKAQISWKVLPKEIGTLVATGKKATLTPTKKGRGVIIAEVITSEGSGIGRISVTVDDK